MAEWGVGRLKAREWRKSAVFRVWHGSCRRLGIPGMVPDRIEKTKEIATMFATETTARLSAAAFAIVLSALSFAYAIIPATPALLA